DDVSIAIHAGGGDEPDPRWEDARRIALHSTRNSELFGPHFRAAARPHRLARRSARGEIPRYHERARRRDFVANWDASGGGATAPIGALRAPAAGELQCPHGQQ